MDKQAPLFEKGGKLERLYPLWEANDTFLFTPGSVTKDASHVRDGVDLKRIMITVVVALTPCILMALYNTGFQANSAMAAHEGLGLYGWQGAAAAALGVAGKAGSVCACIILGLLYFLPVFLVTFVVGGGCEVLFSLVRRHEVNEGFLVTGTPDPAYRPPTIPLWQLAIGVAFGVILGKEIFGGTGMNIFNPALVCRAFLFFAYPAQISGDKCWIAVSGSVDGFSGATALGRAAVADASAPGAAVRAVTEGMNLSWLEAFLGFVPGSMGETSALACLLGAALLIIAGVASWRIMLGGVIGTVGMTLVLNAAGSETNAMMAMPFWWHMVLGGWAFGLTFMATDPVSAPFTNGGRFVYGILIGVFVILIRVVNPAYPEGMMLAILLMNLFSPLINYVAVAANIRRRVARSAAV